MDVLAHNRKAWDSKVSAEDGWTRPVDSNVIADAKNGRLNLLLTPTKPVPLSWYPDLRDKNVLCLAAGGGQQGPIFAAAGANVVALDNSPKQLEQDRFVAKRDDLQIETEQGDMRDLSRFADEFFDLVFHPFSNCFVDDVNTVWKECYRVLKKGGDLLDEFVSTSIATRAVKL
jgi:ubiquinone/menaquinone biosynthesis C-methylase UbiE